MGSDMCSEWVVGWTSLDLMLRWIGECITESVIKDMGWREVGGGGHWVVCISWIFTWNNATPCLTLVPLCQSILVSASVLVQGVCGANSAVYLYTWELCVVGMLCLSRDA